MRKFNIHNEEGVLSVNSGSGIVTGMPARIYTPIETMTGVIWQPLMDQYTFPYKLYDLKPGFIDRVIKTFFHEDYGRNMGVLLSGDKGTGKTVVAKQICNALLNNGVPVITVSRPDEDLPGKIASLGQTVVVFIDEYDKVFGGDYMDVLLGFMDGAQSTEHSILFLLTINSGRISDYMLNRMGRIRYNLSFSRVEPKLVAAITKDSLVDQEMRHDLWNVFSTVISPTVDLLTEVIREANIHEQRPSEFVDVINLKPDIVGYKYVIGLPDSATIILENETTTKTTEPSFWYANGDQWLYVDDVSLGVIKSVVSNSAVIFNAELSNIAFLFRRPGTLTQMTGMDRLKLLAAIGDTTTALPPDEEEREYLLDLAYGMFDIPEDEATEDVYKMLHKVRYGNADFVARGEKIVTRNGRFVTEVEAEYDLL